MTLWLELTKPYLRKQSESQKICEKMFQTFYDVYNLEQPLANEKVLEMLGEFEEIASDPPFPQLGARTYPLECNDYILERIEHALAIVEGKIPRRTLACFEQPEPSSSAANTSRNDVEIDEDLD